MPSIVWTHFKKIPITGIIADLDVAHVFNVTYVDCNFSVFSILISTHKAAGKGDHRTSIFVLCPWTERHWVNSSRRLLVPLRYAN